MAGAAPPSRPTGGAARMGIDLRRRIRPTLKYTLSICATEVKIDRHKLSFLFATWDWTSLWRRRARSSGVGRHGRRHRLDDVRRVQRVPVHANESPRRGRRSESARRRHYPGWRAGRGENTLLVWFVKNERSLRKPVGRESDTNLQRGRPTLRSLHSDPRRPGRAGRWAGRGRGRWARPHLPLSLAPFLRWVQRVQPAE